MEYALIAAFVLVILISLIPITKGVRTKSDTQEASNVGTTTCMNDSFPENIPDETDDEKIERIKKEMDEIKAKIADAREERIKMQSTLKVIETVKQIEPIFKHRVSKLNNLSQALEATNKPKKLKRCKVDMEEHLKWFKQEEISNPYNPLCLKGGADDMLNRTLNRYNEMLYKIVKESFDSYKIRMPELVTEETKTEQTKIIFSLIDEIRGYVETKAENHTECFNSLNDLHYQIEEIFSNSVK